LTSVLFNVAMVTAGWVADAFRTVIKLEPNYVRNSTCGGSAHTHARRPIRNEYPPRPRYNPPMKERPCVTTL